MANANSSIEWTDATWSPTTGCTHVSEGCRFCYAEALSLRFGRSKHPWTKPYEQENVKFHHERMEIPYTWKKPKRIFVDSMSDLFHPLVPDGVVAWVWMTMAKTPQHTYQILTKRPERMLDFVRRWDDLSGESRDFRGVRGPDATRKAHPSGRGQLFAAYLDELGKTVEGGAPPEGSAWPTFDWMEGPRWWTRAPLPNVWLGTSIEDNRVVDRADFLRRTPATVRFLSCEPLIGPLDQLNLTGIDWVITGGESGPHHRPFDPDWARDVRDRCLVQGIAFFHKQNGGRTPKAGGRLLDGREWNGMPNPWGPLRLAINTEEVLT